jgi:hypothetical protein
VPDCSFVVNGEEQLVKPSSFAGHLKIFNDFSGTKFRLKSREQIAELLTNLRAGTIAQTPSK